MVHAASAILAPETAELWGRLHQLTGGSASDLVASIHSYLDTLASSRHDTYTDPFETVAPNLGQY